ncbi:MAG: lysine--tRNA ligase, partial [Ignavibacteriales bacterium]|nr:lysine--tRNA ligase [Ignavibacteriales bacterium]
MDVNKQSTTEKAHLEELNELMIRRRQELDQLLKHGINPYPYQFQQNTYSQDIIKNYRDDTPQQGVSIAGRIMSIRRMGKASFCHVQDAQGKIQVYLKKDDLGSTYDLFKLLDIGDIIGVEGYVFRTKMGEISVHARKLDVLS